MSRRPSAPVLSVVVVVHDMARELPRTLATLASDRQVGLETDEYEVIVVDNGSRNPVDLSLIDRFCGHARLERLDPAPTSPARAANLGIELARADLIGLFIDGARMASPGLLGGARRVAQLAARPIVTAPAFHLGPASHMKATESGYDEHAEDALLAGVPWTDDGYELFNISTPAGSSSRGLFGPMGESNSLFMRRSFWGELGGVDERFTLPGGGLANHDLYRRACGVSGAELFVLLGEATFHQFHGGIATSRRMSWQDMHDDYKTIRCEGYVPPSNEPTYFGKVPVAALDYIEHSARQSLKRARRAGNYPDARPTEPPRDS